MKKGKGKKRPILRRFMVIITSLILFGMIVYAGIIGFVCFKEANVLPPGEYDAIVILGAQVLPNGEPNLQLELRLETALAAYETKSALVVTCGAQGADEPRPEADVMRDWLIARGVPEDQVLSENTSFNTLENIQNALKLLEGRDIDEILVVTSDYHVPRALAIADDAGVYATGAGSPCKPEYWFNNHGREALAWVKYWGQKHLGLSVPNINQWMIEAKIWCKDKLGLFK